MLVLQIQKRTAKVHNTTKYRNALQTTQTTNEMFPGEPNKWQTRLGRAYCPVPYPFRRADGKALKVGLWSEQGTTMPLCSHVEGTWWRNNERQRNFLIISGIYIFCI